MTSGAAIPRNSVVGDASAEMPDIMEDVIANNMRTVAELAVSIAFFILNIL